jgi:hypothetical protein
VAFWDIHCHSYGTDAGKEGESQYGDWRGIGILFANTEDFSISGLRIKDSHGWAISVEACSGGRIEKIDFDAHMHKLIDGIYMNMENEDGIDVRNGCHHITISDISGHTGDDMVALTAGAPDGGLVGGSLCSTHVMGHDWTRRESGIHDIIIRNINGYSQHCYNVRLLACNTKIYNVVIDGIVDVPNGSTLHRGAIRIGERDGVYGVNLPDCISRVTISNVISYAQDAIIVRGHFSDSVISNVINNNRGGEAFSFGREDILNNVLTSNIINV